MVVDALGTGGRMIYYVYSSVALRGVGVVPFLVSQDGFILLACL